MVGSRGADEAEKLGSGNSGCQSTIDHHRLSSCVSTVDRQEGHELRDLVAIRPATSWHLDLFDCIAYPSSCFWHFDQPALDTGRSESLLTVLATDRSCDTSKTATKVGCMILQFCADINCG